MSQLAIKGHAIRSKEVIQILEMLGSKNTRNYACDLIDYAYSINGEGIIDWYIPHPNTPFIIYTLEEFLERYPYKVGDKVTMLKEYPNEVFQIEKMFWDGEEICYVVDNKDIVISAVCVKRLQPYKEQKSIPPYMDYDIKEKPMREIKLDIPEGYEFSGIDNNNKVVLVRNQPHYPKTYEECAQILLERASVRNDIGYKGDTLIALQKLLVCRDAYWKISDWKPDWKDGSTKYIITFAQNEIYKDVSIIFTYILSFPTEEIRNAFYENFKDLIETCKELL